jgi:hypothetical protein
MLPWQGKEKESANVLWFLLGSFMILLIILAISGCATIEETRPNLPVTNPVLLGEKPANLVIGSKFIYKRTNLITDESQTYMWTIKSKVNWFGITAYVIDVGAGFIIWDSNLNWMATLDKNGKVFQNIDTSAQMITPQGTSTVAPSIRVYDWPLKIGKNYSLNYEVSDKANNKIKLSDQIKVEEKTNAKTPVGTWTTYKIRRETAGYIENRFYSPDLGMEVKTEVMQTKAHPQGPAIIMNELVGYDIPGVGSKGEKIKIER